MAETVTVDADTVVLTISEFTVTIAVAVLEQPLVVPLTVQIEVIKGETVIEGVVSKVGTGGGGGIKPKVSPGSGGRIGGAFWDQK